MGPFKCPDCGVWWAGLEHRCRPAETWTGTGVAPLIWQSPDTVTTTTVRCTCPPNRGDNYAGNCPIHDVMVTYTT